MAATSENCILDMAWEIVKEASGQCGRMIDKASGWIFYMNERWIDNFNEGP